MGLTLEKTLQKKGFMQQNEANGNYANSSTDNN